MTSGRVAIVSAMHEELRALLALMPEPKTVRLAGRVFHVGVVHGQPMVLVLSGIGKVAAATTVALAIHEFGASELVFTGVAGGLHADVQVGDVVIADRLLQHDMDASPIFPRFEVPLTGRSFFAADLALSEGLSAAAIDCLGGVLPPGLAGAGPARLHRGLVVSGDRFVSSGPESDELRRLLPAALAVEMEGAAAAQVCADFKCPFAVLRSISDRSDDNAHVDFTRFVEDVASVYTRAILGGWLAGRGNPT